MDVNIEIAKIFLLALALGVSLFSVIAKPQLTGGGFIRLLSAVGFASTFFSFILYYMGTATIWTMATLFYALAFIIQLIVWGIQGDQHTKPIWFFYFAKILALAAIGVLFLGGRQDFLLYFFLTTFILGITAYAMILGHWYLVVPKLSEKPLLVSIALIWVFLTLKLLLSSWGYFQAENHFVSGTELGGGYMFNWILLSMRFLWGYLAMYVLSIFAWKLTRMRSIQSATGVLYVMVFFVLVGEIISLYMNQNYGLVL